MAQQILDFAPIAQGGDTPTAAFVKLDGNVKDHELRLSSVTNTANAASAGLSGKLDAANPQITGKITHTVGALGNNAGNVILPYAMAAQTGNSDVINWYVYRGVAGSGWDKVSWIMRRDIDGFSQGSIEFGQPANGMAVGFSDGAGNYVKVSSGGNLNVAGSIVAGGTVTWSDETLKEDITPIAVKRGMALSLAKAFMSWKLISTGHEAVGITAQTLQKINDRYVFEMDYTAKSIADENGFFAPPEVEKKLGVDNTGAALEASMDNALDIDELKTALAAAIARIAALEARTP